MPRFAGAWSNCARFMLHRLLSILFAGFLLAAAKPVFALDVNTGVADFDEIFSDLAGSNFSKKEDALSRLTQMQQPSVVEMLKALMDGRLHIHKKEGWVVFVEDHEEGVRWVDVLRPENNGVAGSRETKKISINNAMRRLIRSSLAVEGLQRGDKGRKLEALSEILAEDSEDYIQLVRDLLNQETDVDVRKKMELVLSINSLSAQEAQVRIDAIKGVEQSLEPIVRQKLLQMSAADEDLVVRERAAAAIRSIDEQVKWLGHVETLFFGLSLGSVLVLAAIGLAITFGVMGVINMAHGELIMLGAYTTYLIQQMLPGSSTLSLLLSIPAAFLVSGFVGILIERGVIRHLYGRPLETLLATFGISLILQQLVRTLISPQNVPVENPAFMSGFWEVNSVLSLTYNRLYVLLFCVVVFVGLLAILKRSRLGLEVRAVSQNRQMARAMGIHSARVDALTFGLGSGIAGIAGVALSQITNVGPNLGQAYIVDSFMVVVFGGVGNLWGTLIGGFGIGVANKFMEPWAGAVMAKILILVLVILFIQKKPRGLFPQKGRAAEG